MKWHWLFVALTLNCPALAWALQAGTPQAALEELATAEKPEVIARHLPESVRKNIEELPKPAQQSLMQKLLEIKSSQLNGCTVRRSSSGDWEILNQKGQVQAKVRLENAFIAGVDAMLPLQIEASDGSQLIIVTMHLEGDEWRIDGFGPWEKTDFGVRKLVHQPTELETNDAAAKETLNKIAAAVRNYAQWFPAIGYPRSLTVLTVPPPHPAQLPAILFRPILDESFAKEPLLQQGYEFRYLLTASGDGEESPGSFEITASPVRFGITGSKYFLMNDKGLYCTAENRAATDDDDCGVD